MESFSEIIIGNVCSVFAMISDSISGTRKNRAQMLGVQIISQFFYGAGSLILKGYSSVAQNVVAVLRNLAGIKEVRNRVVEWSLVLLGVILGAVFNNRGIFGWIPIIANFEYSVSIFWFKDNDTALKISFIINMVMYSVFSFIISNYVSGIANFIVAITTAVALVKNTQKCSR